MDVKSKIRGLFWVSADDASAPRAAARVQPQAPAQAQPAPAPAPSSSAAAASATMAAAAATAASASTSSPSLSPGPGTAGDAAAPDFAAIYARTNSAGDPRVDQVLAAFEAMKAAMPPAQLAIAVGATAAAIGADRTVIADTLARRLEAIDAVVASEQRGAAQRQADRASKLAAATAAAQAEIEAAEARIAALRQQLAAATASAQQHDAREQGLATAFEHRAREEAARLVALRDFLARPAAATGR